MTDTTKKSRSRRPPEVARGIIERAALQAFYGRGYHGTSTRDIAAGAGMTAASLYHHFTNKQDILRVVMTQIMQESLASTRSALLASDNSPPQQLAAFVRAWVWFHANRQVEAKVGLAELNSLNPDVRRVVVALRDEQELMVRDVIERGVAQGYFGTVNPTHATRAVVNMGTAIATWFRPKGALSVEELAEIYVELALATVESTSPRKRQAPAAAR